jgi:hypothetical protein
LSPVRRPPTEVPVPQPDPDGHADPAHAYRLWPDERLLAECRWDAFRGPGPGGQKRNKTSSGVRVTHGPTGLAATATTSRSQTGNKADALRRLRLRLVFETRAHVDPASFVPPAWFADLLRARGGRLAVGARDGLYLPTVGLVLDALESVNWSLSDTARLLGLSTAGLSGFLGRDDKLLEFVNGRRAAYGLRPLREG